MNYSFYNYRFVPVNPFTYFVPTPPLLSVKDILVFSSRSFIVSHPTFRPLIHLEMFSITSHVAICSNKGRF